MRDNSLSTTALAKKLNLDLPDVFTALKNVGWIKRNNENTDWELTEIGKSKGGHIASFILWPKATVMEIEKIVEQENEKVMHGTTIPESRNRPPKRLKTEDGHLVRSRAEAIIDNYLFYHRVIHAYGRKIWSGDEAMKCDFYIPVGKEVYIEYWGKEDDEEYRNRKMKKIEMYKKNELNLIELHASDINRLSDILPGKLLKYEIKGYM